MNLHPDFQRQQGRQANRLQVPMTTDKTGGDYSGSTLQIWRSQAITDSQDSLASYTTELLDKYDLNEDNEEDDCDPQDRDLEETVNPTLQLSNLNLSVDTTDSKVKKMSIRYLLESPTRTENDADKTFDFLPPPTVEPVQNQTTFPLPPSLLDSTVSDTQHLTRRPALRKRQKRAVTSPNSSTTSPLQCQICQKTFTRSDNLRTHQRVHTKERPYQCTVCDASFAQAATLTKHALVHSGERPYECNICGARFTQVGHLSTHRKLHAEKPFKCGECKRMFRGEAELEVHRAMHGGSSSATMGSM